MLVMSFCKFAPKVVFRSNIQVQHSIPYTPQQNGVEERKNRSHKEMTTYMLELKKLAANLWDEAMHAIEYI